MPHWIRAASSEDCPPGASLETVVEDRIVALFNVDGRLYALDGVCPHQGGPLGKGVLQGCVVTCPWHGWQFNVTDGQHQTTTALRHPSYEVKLENDSIWVNLEAHVPHD